LCEAEKASVIKAWELEDLQAAKAREIEDLEEREEEL
jgi:hypothetical protein